MTRQVFRLPQWFIEDAEESLKCECGHLQYLHLGLIGTQCVAGPGGKLCPCLEFREVNMTDPYEERTTREQHLAWAKGRALEFLAKGDVVQAWSSFASDITKHRGTHSLMPEVGRNSVTIRSEIEMREYLAALD